MFFTKPLLYGMVMALIDVFILSALKMRRIGDIVGNWVFPVAMLVYGFQPLIFYNALKISSLTIMNLMWDLSSDVIVTLIGLFIFKETLSLKQKLGVGLGLIAIFLLK
jgi:drug/metabolite transporter (DMT)-like permease